MIGLLEDLTISQTVRLSADLVDSLVAQEAFYAYRHWQGFGKDVPRQLLRWELLHMPPEAMAWVAMRGSTPVGIACVAPNAWESEQLATRIGGFRHLLAAGAGLQRQDTLRVLLDTVQADCRDRFDCLVRHVDIGDTATIAALQAAGAHLVDTGVSFIRAGRDLRPYLRRTFPRRCTVRPYQDADRPAVEALARQTYFGGRFYHDAHFSRARVDALYQAWVRRCVDGTFADRVVVALRQGEVGALLAYQFQGWLNEAAQVRLMGRGLLAVRPDCRGLALEVVRGACLWEADADYLQCDVHLENLDVVGLLGKGCRMDVAHLRHVFHWWLRESDGA
jgi:hypothetical protein